MTQPLSQEAAFALGAEAMKSKITAWLMMNGYMTVAPKVLTLENPAFSMPESVTIEPIKQAAETRRVNVASCNCNDMAGQSFFEWRCPVHGYQSDA